MGLQPLFSLDFTKFTQILKHFDEMVAHKCSFGGTFTSWAPGGARIMDLDQYLEKMNTNTNVI